MGENFFININCSRILADNDETQYTMLVDSTKISIVYELIEWIRWMFSIEYCVYLSHENSVIHELEDIQILSKLKNFEIKPCGRSHCVHKTTYRVLLSNLNLFVIWNEMKVHKYFVDKISQIDQKLTQESNRANTGMIISSSIRAHEDLMDCNKSNIRIVNDNFSFSDSQPSDSSVKNSSFIKKAAVIDSSVSGSIANGNLQLKMKSHLNKNPTISPLKNKLEIEQLANNNCSITKRRKNSSKYFKPFSVGDILSSIRKDFEKQNTEIFNKKNATQINFSVSEEGNSIDKMFSENSVLISEDKITEIKKRQRTRKRKKSKKQNLESETCISPFLEGNDSIRNINCYESSNALKPNHIRFDVDDEDNSMDSNCVKDNINIQNKNEFEVIQEKIDHLNSLTFFKAEPEKSSIVINDDYQDLSDSQLLNSSIINTENKMECSAINDLSQIEEKQTDLGDQIPNNINQSCCEAENFQSVSFNPNLNILASLKENCRNSVVMKRFY